MSAMGGTRCICTSRCGRHDWHGSRSDKQSEKRSSPRSGRRSAINLGAGAELVGVARNDTDTPHRADYDYVAVWKIPNIERVHTFAETWVRVGFHDYFEQEDVRGELMAPDAFIGHHIGL